MRDAETHETGLIADQLNTDVRGTEVLREMTHRKSVAIIGARDVDATGLTWTSRVTERAVQHHWVIVSGGARGVDEQAHRVTASLGGDGLAILGCGLDKVSRRHRRLSQLGIGLASPFSSEMSARRWTFPKRNQYIADISDVIIVIQASAQSGALSTARDALRHSKPVWVVTHLPEVQLHQGCLQLINEGARALVSVDSWLDEYPMEPLKSPTQQRNSRPVISQSPSPLNLERAAAPLPTLEPTLRPTHDSPLWRATTAEPRSLAQLALEAGVPLTTAMSEATILELEGWLTPALGGLYVRAYGEG